MMTCSGGFKLSCLSFGPTFTSDVIFFRSKHTNLNNDNTCLLEDLELFAGELPDGSGHSFESTFQSLAQHHVVRFGSQADAVLVFVCRQSQLSHIQFLKGD